MKRWLFSSLLLLSLALCAVVAVAWRVSYSQAFGVERRADTQDGGSRSATAVFDRGRLRLYSVRDEGTESSGAVATWNVVRRPPQDRWSYGERSNIAWGTAGEMEWSNLGVRRSRLSIEWANQQSPTVVQESAIPCSYLTAAFAVSPIMWSLAWLRRRQRLRHPAACRRCGYNLTGNVSGVCPECGTAVPRGAAP